MSADPDGDEALLEDLREIRARSQPRRGRLAWTLRLGSLAVAASFVWLLRGDLRYAAASPTPLELGGPLEFSLSHQASQTFAHIRGVPGAQAANVSHLGHSLRIFGLLGSNVVVVQDRDAPGAAAPPSSGAPFDALGRLVRDDDDRALKNVFLLMERAGYVAPQSDGHLYALYVGERPRRFGVLALELLGIALFVGVNWRAAARVSREPEPPAVGG